MGKKDIKNRADIFLLVSTFYEKVRKDALLGPFFNETIEDWEEHLLSRSIVIAYHGDGVPPADAKPPRSPISSDGEWDSC